MKIKITNVINTIKSTIEPKAFVAGIIAWAIINCVISSCSANDNIHYPPKGLGSYHTYTVWNKINWGYKSKDLIDTVNPDISDTYGIVRYGDFMAGACTTTIGQVGDCLLVVQDNGFVYPVVIADTKSQADNGCTVWGHQNGRCIIEFEVLSSMTSALYNGTGWYISELINQPIYKIINLGSVFYDPTMIHRSRDYAIEYGLAGYTMLTSPYGGYVI